MSYTLMWSALSILALLLAGSLATCTIRMETNGN